MNPPVAPDAPPPTLIIATAGHVDHGKTTLVKALTGVDTDTLADEKRRGVSINLGYAYTRIQHPELGEMVLGFVDVPGHVDFINNMLAGVGAVHYGLLVVAGDDGVMPQTREHLQILNLLGIEKGVIALTKVDRAEARQLEQVTNDIKALVSGSALARAPIVEVSAPAGTGLEALRRALLALVSAAESENDTQHRPRFLVDRSFSVKGIGTVVTGTLLAGTLDVNDEDGQSPLLHSASGVAVRVKSLRIHDRDTRQLRSGQRAALNIALPQHQLQRGDWLLDPLLYHPVQRFDARLELLEPGTRLRSGTRYHLYCNASHRLVSVRVLSEAVPDLVQIKSDQPLLLCQGDRFILRDPAASTTLGGGRVIDSFVPRRGRASAARLAELEDLDNSVKVTLERRLRASELGIDLNTLARNRNLTPTGLEAALETLPEDLAVTRLNTGEELPVILSTSFYESWCERTRDALHVFHHEQRNKQGIAESELQRRLEFTGTDKRFHALIEKMVTEGIIVRTGTLLHLPDHKAQLSEAEQQFLAKIRPLLREAGWVPPRTRELMEMTNIPLASLERTLKELTRAGSLVQVADNRHYLPETLIELAEFTEKLAAKSDTGFTVIEFRDASQIGRNLCIEILEYFDRVGFTRREDNQRFLRTARENIFGA